MAQDVFHRAGGTGGLGHGRGSPSPDGGRASSFGCGITATKPPGGAAPEPGIEFGGDYFFFNDTATTEIYTMSVGAVYPHYVAKAEKKGRTQAEVDEIFRWLTGYSAKAFASHLAKGTDFETFFAQAPKLNPARKLITGVICGVRIEEIEDPLMREVRYLDKLIDELAKGKPMNKGAAGDSGRRSVLPALGPRRRNNLPVGAVRGRKAEKPRNYPA